MYGLTREINGERERNVYIEPEECVNHRNRLMMTRMMTLLHWSLNVFYSHLYILNHHTPLFSFWSVMSSPWDSQQLEKLSNQRLHGKQINIVGEHNASEKWYSSDAIHRSFYSSYTPSNLLMYMKREIKFPSPKLGRRMIMFPLTLRFRFWK